MVPRLARICGGILLLTLLLAPTQGALASSSHRTDYEAADQANLTVGALLEAAQRLLTHMQNVGTSLMGNSQIVLGGATTQVSGLMAQFDRMAGSNLTAPITSLGTDARIVAMTLDNMLTRLNDLVTRQHGCILANLDLFLAGVHTITDDFTRAIPLTSTASPRLTSFKFVDRHASNVVPRGGGRVVLRGYRLVEDGQAPEITVYAKDQKTVLARVTGDGAGSEHEASFDMPAAIIASNTGDCLRVGVKTYGLKKRFLRKSARYQTGEVYTSMCIPEAYGMHLAMDTEISYTVGVPETRVLSTKRFSFVNGDMRHRANVTDTKGWTNEIPAGWRIMEVNRNVVRRVLDSNIGVAFTDQTVTLAGWLGDAEDINPPIGPRIKLRDAVYVADVTPIIAGTVAHPRKAHARVEFTPMGDVETRLCARVPVEGQPDPTTTFNVTITPSVAGAGAVPALYESSRLSTNRNMLTYNTAVDAYDIALAYNPTVVDGTCEVCATVRRQACAF